ncbi:MAG: TonB-dependent receptor [Ignavibacteriaceae bacterium]
MKALLLIVSLLLLEFNFTENLAQEIGTLRGTVTDSSSGEALPFSNILIVETGQGASADMNGNFIITSIPPNKNYTVRCSYVGFETQDISVYIKSGTITQLRIALKPSSIELQTIEKIGEKYQKPNETDLGLQRLDIRQIEYIPQSVETDIFRSLQFLPGVQSTGDVSAKYYVRGGASNQNLVLFNGASVYNPFHALGLFSIIDPETINAVEFYKGGFTAEFGGRLSSVLNLVTKDGNKNNYSSSASMSFLTAKASVEGPLPFGSFIVTGRKSTFNDILRKFLNFRDAPFDFHDISFKINYANTQWESLTKFSLHGFNSLDQLINDDPEQADYKWSNNIYGLYWFQEWEDVPIYSELNFSVSKFHGEVLPKQSITKPRLNKVDDISLRGDVTYINANGDEVMAGYSLKALETKLQFENLQGAETDLGQKGLQFAFYTKYRFLQWEDLGADVGFRLNMLTLTKKRPKLVEPRVNLTYRLLSWLALKAAWGIYSQDLITLTNESEVVSLFEPWTITPDYLDVPEATHYVVGLEFDALPQVNFSVEGFYKLIDNLAEPNDEKATASDPDFVAGKGESYGWEFLLRFDNPSVRATASYSLSWAYKEVAGWIFYPKYDTRHAVSLNFTYLIGDGWQASATWFYNSGLPFTPVSGYYDKLYLDDLFNPTGIYGNYIPFTILGDKNISRLPDYHRLDLSISKQLTFYFLDLELSASVINVYDRKNIFYFERDTGKQVNMLPILPSATVKIKL